MKKRKIIIGLIAAAVLCTAGAGVFWHIKSGRNAAPDFSKKTVEEIQAYMDSNDFRDLDPNLRREQGWAAIQEMMGKTAEEYCMLPPEKRTEYLDQVIDRMMERRQQFEQRREEFRSRREAERQTGEVAGDSSGDNQARRRSGDGQRGQRAPSLERMRSRSESISPQRRAAMNMFRDAMRQRMQERGISGPGAGRGF